MIDFFVYLSLKLKAKSKRNDYLDASSHLYMRVCLSVCPLLLYLCFLSFCTAIRCVLSHHSLLRHSLPRPLPVPSSLPIPSPCHPPPLAISEVEKTFRVFAHSGENGLRTDLRTDQRTHGRTDLWTDRPADRPTDGRANGRTDPLIEMRGRI